MKKIIVVLSFLVIALPVVGQTQMFNSCTENETADISVTLPTSFTTARPELPNPFMKLDNTPITTKEEWAQRRQEIYRLAERTIYGVKPPKPSKVTGSVTRTGNSGTISVTVSNGGADQTFTASVAYPTTGTAPFPAVIRLGEPTMASTGSGADGAHLRGLGVATITFIVTNVGGETGGNRANRTGVFYNIYGTNHEAGSLVAWSWGVSRIIDVIEESGREYLDPTAIGVTGCSRLGKGALAVGVFDQRIALTLAMEGGTGGTNIMRGAFADRGDGGGCGGTGDGAQCPASAYGEQPWLSSNFQPFITTPNNLPIDMHSVMGLIAPRGFMIMDKRAANVGNWLGIPSSYRGALAGAKIYEALGVGGNMHYINDVSGGHCAAPAEYNTHVEDFVRKFLLRTRDVTPNTSVTFTATTPAPSMTTPSYMPWTTPTLSGNLTIGGCGPAPSGFTLSTTAVPAEAGEITLSPDPPSNGRYDEGASVTVTQTPGADWEFTGWSGACNGTGPCVVIMNKNETVTAEYKRPDGFIDPTNLIRNGTFANTQNWTLNTWSGSVGSFAVSGGNGNINITTLPSGEDAADHSLQLIQNGFTLTQGLTYRLTFEASAAQARTMGVVVEMHERPWDSYMDPQTANLTTDMQQFSYIFKMDSTTDENSRLSFNVGNADPNVQIRNVSLVQVAPEEGDLSISGVPAAKAQKSSLRAAALQNRAINVSFRANSDGETAVKLYNLRGNLISSQKLKTAAGVNYSHTFSTSKLPNGFYIVRVQGGGIAEQTRVMIHR